MQACFACLTTRTMRCVKMEVARSGEAVVGENDGDDMSEDEGREVEIQGIKTLRMTSRKL